MYVLTKDSQARSQLSLLLRDLGHRPEFYENVDELLPVIAANKTPTTCLIDVHVNLDENAIIRFKLARSYCKLVGFERYQTERENTPTEASAIFALTIILPSHAERAKSRLKAAIRQTNFAQSAKRANSRPSFPLKRSLTNTPGIFSKTKRPFAVTTTTSTTIPNFPRYLVNESAPARVLVNELKTNSTSSSSILLVSEDEAEFELVAREINYFANRDHTPIEVISGDEISLDYLQNLERKANSEKSPLIAYVGRVDDWNERAIRELILFDEFLSNLRNPHLRLIMAHQKGTEEFFQWGVGEHFSKLSKQVHSIRVPRLMERPEDIASICQILIGSMRAAHPFLLVGRISKEAIDNLIENRANYSYAKLVRILRNSIALSQRATLQIEDIKNYGESDLTTQHLLESMADEQYFPAKSANF